MLPTNSLDAIKWSQVWSFIFINWSWNGNINMLLSLISLIFDVNFEFLTQSL